MNAIAIPLLYATASAFNQLQQNKVSNTFTFMGTEPTMLLEKEPSILPQDSPQYQFYLLLSCRRENSSNNVVANSLPYHRRSPRSSIPNIRHPL
jgi:hypothetical protein